MPLPEMGVWRRIVGVWFSNVKLEVSFRRPSRNVKQAGIDMSMEFREVVLAGDIK